MKILTLAFILLLSQSCSKESDLEFSSSAPQIPPPEQTEENAGSFAKLQTQVIVPNCIRCHANFTVETELKKLIIPGNAEASHLFKHVEDGSMPPDREPLSTEQLEVIKQYINELQGEGPRGEGPRGEGPRGEGPHEVNHWGPN